MTDQARQGLLSPFLQQARLKVALPHIHGRVLDVGCGNGLLAAHVGRSDYAGFDRDETALAQAALRCPSHEFVDRYPEGQTFDTVVALAVIEHLPDPVNALLKWGASLKDNGRIVLTTPHKAFDWIHDAGSKFGLFSHDAADEHEVLFNRRLLEAAAAGAKLRVNCYKRFLLGANQLCVLGR